MAITFVQARDLLVAHVNTTLQTHLPTLKVFYENTVAVDVNTVGDTFLQVEVSVEDSLLATVSSDLMDKVTGYVGFRLFLKEGKGTRAGLAIFDTLNAQMRHQDLGGVRTGTCSMGRKESRDGWLSMEFGAPFEYFTG
jgi:hypothetical protein